VLLTGEVIINRKGQGRLRPLRAVTSKLRVRPLENYAETDRHVRIDSRDDWLESDGAEIWFEEPVRMKFLSSVKARYEIN
jgi:lipopolysaccharide export system protein LptC